MASFVNEKIKYYDGMHAFFVGFHNFVVPNGSFFIFRPTWTKKTVLSVKKSEGFFSKKINNHQDLLLKKMKRETVVWESSRGCSLSVYPVSSAITGSG